MQPSQLKRREFITLFGGAVAIVSSRIVLGQQTDRMPRVGVLMAFPESDLESQRRAEAFQQRLRELGLQDGRNIHIDFRWGTAEPDQTARNAKELIDLKPNVLVGTTTPGVAALLRETRTIPIVFVGVADPVGQRFITSLARPGGNITGFTSFEFSLGGKWLEILKEIAPQVARAAILFNPDTVPYAGFVRRSRRLLRHLQCDRSQRQFTALRRLRLRSAHSLKSPMARCSCFPISMWEFTANWSLIWPPSTIFRQFLVSHTLLPMAGLCLMAPTNSTRIVGRPRMSIAFSRAPSRATCQCSSRSSTSLSSTSRLPRHSASTCLSIFNNSPTR